MEQQQKRLRAQLHTLVGNEMKSGKRLSMFGGQPLHEEAHKKAEDELEKFLKENPSMMEHVETVEEHFRKQIYP